MNTFAKATVIQLHHGAAIIELEDGTRGYLPNNSMRMSTQDKLINNNLLEHILDVRYLQESKDSAKLPTYTQRQVFNVGDTYEFMYKSENDRFVILLGKDDCEYITPRKSWEKGPQYCPSQIGEKIKCRVSQLSDDFPYLDRENIDNPYFRSPREILNDHVLIQSIFDVWMDNPSTDFAYKMREDYNNKNANYILSLLHLLEDQIYNLLRLRSFVEASRYVDAFLEIEDWIKSSGFLIPLHPDNRKKAKFAAQQAIDSMLIIRRVVNIINFNQSSEFLFDLTSKINIISNFSMKDFLDDILVFTKLYGFVHIDLLDIDMVENVIAALRNKNLLFLYEDPYFGLRIQLSSARKSLRRRFYNSQITASNIRFENNRIFRHYIFLKEHEVEVCEMLQHYNTALLERATLLYLTALYNEDIDLKKDIVNKSLSILDNIEGKLKMFHENEDKKQWGQQKNIVQGWNYELLANLCKSLKEKHGFLTKSKEHYSFAKYYRSWLVSDISDYIGFLISLTDVDENSIKAIIKKANRLSETMSYKRRNGKDQQENETLLLIYNTFSQIGETTDKSIEWLIEKARLRFDGKCVFTNVIDLVRITLANNLLAISTNQSLPLFSVVKKLLLEGDICLPINPFGDEREDTQSDHEIFLEEGENIEFKGSFEYDIDRYLRTNEEYSKIQVSDSICKSVVGMLNRNGGRIYIGVLETDIYKNEEDRKKLISMGAIIKNNRIVLGIDSELRMKKWNIDVYMRHIMQIFRNRMGDDVGTYIRVEPQLYNNRTICCVEITNYPKPEGVWLDNQYAYIRENNETVNKIPAEFTRYLMVRQTKV